MNKLILDSFGVQEMDNREMKIVYGGNPYAEVLKKLGEAVLQGELLRRAGDVLEAAVDGYLDATKGTVVRQSHGM